jgi:ribosomal protein S27AE
MVQALPVPQRKVYNMYKYNNTNVYKYVSDMNIPSGSTKRVECPNCGERTFTVTNNMGSLLWNCFRVTCGIKGGDRVHLSVDDIRAGVLNTKKVVEDVFELPQYILPRSDNLQIRSWCEQWSIDPDELGLLYDVKDNRVVFPVIMTARLWMRLADH